jgi:hypothetical protein
MQQDFGDDDEDSEDESFNDSGDDDDDDEDEEDEKSDSQQKGGDVDMIDEECDKREVKALQKEVGNIDLKAGRPKRAGRK